jgi:hypothetical protein
VHHLPKDLSNPTNIIKSIMDELMICELRKMLSRGVRVAWATEDAFHEIGEVVFVSDEERATFADGSGRYVDLFNVSPNSIVSFENVFSKGFLCSKTTAG